MADFDIDDELLMLAGEASEDEEDTPIETTETAASPPDRSTSKAKESGGRKAGHNDSEEEEGEASSRHSSPTSQRSAPMDESESDSDASPIFDDGEKYPLEGKYRNAADKAEIMSMPEVRREQVLAERAQETDDYNRQLKLRQFLNNRDNESKKNDKKRKDPPTEDTRKTSRQRTKLGGGKVGEASSGIDRLKRSQEEKRNKQRQREEDRERNRGRKESSFSDGEADGDSDVDWDSGRLKTKKSKSPEYRDAEPAGIKEVERIRVGRSQFGKVCFYPGFDGAITGCFVRISIGEDDHKQNIYRAAIIKGFTEGKPYAVENPVTKKKFMTTQYLRAAHGKAERPWPFITCSDSPFTEAEWNRLKQTCLVEGVALPTKPKTIDKVNDINNLINRSWTESELQEKLNKSGVLVSKYSGIRRNQLINDIKDAKKKDNIEKVASLEKELAELDGPKLGFGTSLANAPMKPSSTGLNQQQRLAVLNAENKRKNIQEVRDAQIRERREASRIEAALKRGENVAEDHSRRVKTKATFRHDVHKDEKKAASSTTSGTSTPVPGEKKCTGDYLSKLAKEREEKGAFFLRKPKTHDDIIGEIDLGIDLEL